MEAEQNEVEALTPESLFQSMNQLEYKIARVFNKEFFNAEDLGATKPDIKQGISQSISDAKEILSDEEEKKKALAFASKLYALLAVHDYLREDKSSALEEFYGQVKGCGWEALKEEPWAVEFVMKVSGCANFQAIKALESTPSFDLSEAAAKAPSMPNEPPTATGVPPTAEAVATMRRVKKKK